MNGLKLRRYERGLDLADVARSTGLTRQTISRLERTERPQPSAATAKALADFYGVSVAELLSVERSAAA